MSFAQAEPNSSKASVDFADYRSCGVVALYAAGRLLGADVALSQVRQSADPDNNDVTSFADLQRAASEIGIVATPCSLDFDELRLLDCPAIAHLRPNPITGGSPHFSLILGVEGNGRVATLDPPYPQWFWKAESFKRVWTGNTIILTRNERESAEVLNRIQQSRGGAALYIMAYMPLILGACTIIVWWTILRRLCRRPQMAAIKVLFLAQAITAVVGCGNRGSTSDHFGSAPKLVFRGLDEGDVIALGVVPLDRREMSIGVLNTGEVPLEITSVSASCACTVAEFPKNVPPSTSADVIVAVTVTSPGPSSARITVTSNSPDSPHHVVVTWFGEHPPKLSPAVVNREVDPSDVFSMRVAVVFAGGDRSQLPVVRAVEVSTPEITVEKSDSTAVIYNQNAWAANEIAVAGELPYSISCDTSKAHQHIEGEVRFVVEQAGKTTTLTLPVRIAVRGVLRCLPASAALTAPNGTLIEGREVQLTLIVKDAGAEPEIVESPAFLTHSIRPDPRCPKGLGEKWYRIVLGVVRQPKEDDARRLLVSMSGNSNDQLEIPISIGSSRK